MSIPPLQILEGLKIHTCGSLAGTDAVSVLQRIGNAEFEKKAIHGPTGRSVNKNDSRYIYAKSSYNIEIAVNISQFSGAESIIDAYVEWYDACLCNEKFNCAHTEDLEVNLRKHRRDETVLGDASDCVDSIANHYDRRRRIDTNEESSEDDDFIDDSHLPLRKNVVLVDDLELDEQLPWPPQSFKLPLSAMYVSSSTILSDDKEPPNNDESSDDSYQATDDDDFDNSDEENNDDEN